MRRLLACLLLHVPMWIPERGALFMKHVRSSGALRVQGAERIGGAFALAA
jgi:hypothetical protein